MKNYDVLDVQQMLHLQELGLDINSTSTLLSWIVDKKGNEEPFLRTTSEAVDYYVDNEHEFIPAYSLQDVLKSLPYIIRDKGIPAPVVLQDKECELVIYRHVYGYDENPLHIDPSMIYCGMTFSYAVAYEDTNTRNILIRYESCNLLDAAYGMLRKLLELGWCKK